MTDTITPASLRAAAKVNAALGWAEQAQICLAQADEMEAESARENRLAELERVYRSVDSPLVRDGLAAVLGDVQRDAEWLIAEAVWETRIAYGEWPTEPVKAARNEEALRLAKRLVEEEFGGYNQWHDLSTSEQERRIQYVKFILDFLAADGRLLPEGGTEEAAQTCEDMCEDSHGGLVCTRLAGHPGRHVAHNEKDQPLHAWPATPPAVAAPGSGPDGTPEKPWPSLHAVPTTVREVRSTSGFRWERRTDTVWKGCDEHSYNGDCSAGHPEDGPFVRVDGGK